MLLVPAGAEGCGGFVERLLESGSESESLSLPLEDVQSSFSLSLGMIFELGSGISSDAWDVSVD